MMEPFDFFEKVRNNWTSIVLIPIEEVLPEGAMKLVRDNWKSIIGIDCPKRLVYVIYDNTAIIPFTGTIDIFYIKIILYFRKGFMWNHVYTAR